MWVFEPSVAEQVFERLVQENEITVHRDRWLDRGPAGVTRRGGKLRSIRTLDGSEYHGRMFIDATYEGDLMAAAGVDYHVGREANSVYDEQWNGVQVGVLHHKHHFVTPVDPYITPGEPDSGRLPGISGRPPGRRGDADDRVQAYCFRMCLTQVEENRIPFPKPEGYDAGQYELFASRFGVGVARAVPQIRSDSQSEDRHQQSRPLQHRLHRHELRLPRGRVRASRGNHPTT